MSYSPEAMIEWAVQHIDEIFEKHPDLKKKLYEKLKRELEENLATKEDIKNILLELKALREDFNRLSEEVKALREDFNRLSEEVKNLHEKNMKLREDFNRGFRRLDLKIEALGARWGILSEEAFRGGMKYVVEEFFGGKVDKWEYYDDKGYVFGIPSIIDIDVLIKDSKHILIEIKSRIDMADVITFKRKAEVYMRVNNVQDVELVMVSPFVTEKALRLGDKLKIKIITSIP